MTGNCHVQFLGEGVAATPPPYPTTHTPDPPDARPGPATGRGRDARPGRRGPGGGDGGGRRQGEVRADAGEYLPGHSDARTTDLYNRTVEEVSREIVDPISN
jgi:hypothetical protein